jgi:hypothetical protein
MAKPPEPLSEMLPLAAVVVEARVARVLSTGAPAPRPEAPAGHRDVGMTAPEQTLVLEVARVLKGEAGATLEVKKPAAGYAVAEGTKGAWLIDANGVVLGRYGPDSWPLARVTAALTSGS